MGFFSSKKFRIVVFGLVILGVFIFLTWNIWYSRIYAIEVLWFTRNNPVVDQVPIQKTFSDTDVSYGRDFIYQNIIFSMPWTDVDWTRGGKDTLAVKFEGAGRRGFLLVEEIGIQDAMNEDDVEKVEELFDLRSNYYAYSKTLALTRSDINLLASRSDFVPKSLLLLIKAVVVPEAPLGMYQFENRNAIRGFEFV